MTDVQISLTAPSLKTCKEIEVQQPTLFISDAFADCTSALLSRMRFVSIMYLHIHRTPLSHDSVHCIFDLLQKLKGLYLINVNLPSNSLRFIFNALTTNESLEEFLVRFDRGIIMFLSSTSATFYAQAISDVIRRNVTLTRLTLHGLQLDENGVLKILDALANHNTALQLLSLDHSHQATGYRFSEENGPIKDRVIYE